MTEVNTSDLEAPSKWPLEEATTPTALLDYYEEMRAKGGDVVWSDEMGAWLVFSYELSRKMAVEENEFWQTPLVPDPRYVPPGINVDEWVTLTSFSTSNLQALPSGPEYDRMHRWWFRALSPKVLRGWGDTLIHPIAHAQIDRFADLGHAELVEEFAERVTPRVLVAIMGLPWEDEDLLARLVKFDHLRQAAVEIGGERSRRKDVEAGLAAMEELGNILLPFVRERQSGEGDDFISLTWRDAEHLFDTADVDEMAVLTVATNMIGAGLATTTSTIANGLHLLMTTPGLEDRIRATGDRAAATFHEEILRLSPAANYRGRFAKTNTTLGGVEIKEGDCVIMIDHFSNRDSRHYPHPTEFDVERKAPRDHLGFGMGPRTCPGQSIARFQLEASFSVLFERLRDFRLDPDQPAPQYLGGQTRKWAPIHALFTAVS